MNSRLDDMEQFESFFWKWIDVESSFIDKIKYDILTRRMRIQFKNGSIYLYNKIPPKLFKEFMNADSKGKFFHKYMRDVPSIPYRKIKGSALISNSFLSGRSDDLIEAIETSIDDLKIDILQEMREPNEIVALNMIKNEDISERVKNFLIRRGEDVSYVEKVKNEFDKNPIILNEIMDEIISGVEV